MNVINIIIAEVFDIYRIGLTTVLNDYANFKVIESVKSGKDLIKAFKKNPRSICLISSGLPDTNIHDIMKDLKQIHDDAAAVILTHSTDLSHLNQSLKAGVKGYITKNISIDELTDIILAVASGEQVFSKAVSQAMVGNYADLTKRTASLSKRGITKREKEVLKLIVEGNTSAEIATKLYISTRTVETHRSNLMNKLNLKNTAALVRFAIEEEDLF